MKTKRRKVTIVSVNSIQEMKGHRPVDKEQVASMAESIRRIGLRTPITLIRRERGLLVVAGLHRLAAAKVAGLSKIPCFIIKGSNANARAWRLSENFHRAELNKLERAEAADEWRRLFHKKSISAKGSDTRDKGIAKAAKTTGLSRETVRRSKTIAGMSKDAKREVRRLGLHDNQRALLTVASQPTAATQVRKARELSENGRVPAHSGSDGGKSEKGVAPNKEFSLLQKSWKRAKKFRLAWKRSHKKIRHRFVSEIMMS